MQPGTSTPCYLVAADRQINPESLQSQAGSTQRIGSPHSKNIRTFKGDPILALGVSESILGLRYFSNLWFALYQYAVQMWQRAENLNNLSRQMQFSTQR
ncbi:unnamed protein product [Hymenolepis diminuta]|uniref:Uncharacterized protein n=1 Tax=Hymenolepis diminuta TaxID=6216 RepID=A0A564YBJ0_HYMDI|nr:unnamed protein product [Hymenolepis diminuta]